MDDTVTNKTLDIDIDVDISIVDYLKQAVSINASDIFIVAGKNLTAKVDGDFVDLSSNKLKPDNTARLIHTIYELASRDMSKYTIDGDDDFSLSIRDLARFRVNAYKQRGSLAAVVRVVRFGIPDHKEINIPDNVIDAYKLTHGMLLLTGTAGSGKSTTLACLIDKINKSRESHIITIEDPIEFLHQDCKSIISQRELFTDTNSYTIALRAALRQAPDVILIGELRDLDTIQVAITAAETGHLVISTLHTLGTANAIDRLIDLFTAEQQYQIRTELSQVLKTVISQQLVRSTSGSLIPAFEVMHVNTAIANLIRDNKIHQIPSIIQSSKDLNMQTMDSYLIDLYKHGDITKEVLLQSAMNKEAISKKFNT